MINVTITDTLGNVWKCIMYDTGSDEISHVIWHLTTPIMRINVYGDYDSAYSVTDIAVKIEDVWVDNDMYKFKPIFKNTNDLKIEDYLTYVYTCAKKRCDVKLNTIRKAVIEKQIANTKREIQYREKEYNQLQKELDHNEKYTKELYDRLRNESETLYNKFVTINPQKFDVNYHEPKGIVASKA